LVKSKAKKTKRFVKGLKSEITSKLIPLQLRNYLQAVKKALEVEIDIQESQEDWMKGLSVPKHLRYQGPSGSVALGSTSNKGFAAFRKGEWIRGRGSWLRNRNAFQGAQTTYASHPRITEAPWCQKCKTNHSENCIQERTCYNYGGIGHLKKNCSIMPGS